MQDERSLTPEDRETAEAMGLLRPARPQLTRDAVLLETYRLAGRRQTRLWRGIAAALAAGLVLSLQFRPPPKTTERVVYLRNPTTVAEPEPLVTVESPRPSFQSTDSPPTGYLALRHDVLAWGPAALPHAPAAAPAKTPQPERLVSPNQSPTILDFLSRSFGGRS